MRRLFLTEPRKFEEALGNSAFPGNNGIDVRIGEGREGEMWGIKNIPEGFRFAGGRRHKNR